MAQFGSYKLYGVI